MRDYFTALFAISVVGAIVSALPNGSMAKYVKYIAALICVIVIVAPLKPIAETVADFAVSFQATPLDETAECVRLSSQFVAEKVKKDTAEYISSLIYEKMGIKPLAVNIDLESTANTVSIEKITVVLKEGDKEMCNAVSEYLENSLGVGINVE